VAEQPEHFVNLSDGRVHFRCAGADDGPTVILVHGFSYGSWTFNFLGPLLVEAGYRVFALDLYGRGFSDRPKVRHDRGLYNRLLSEFLDAVEIDEPVIFVGNSMGGGVVTDFAAHHPGQVRGLLLLVPAGLRLSAPMSLGWLGVPVIGDLIWRWVGPGLAQSGSKVPDVRKMADAAMAQQAAIPGYYPSLLNTLRHFPLDGLQGSFEAVGVQGTPVAALFGADDDLIPIEAADILQAAIPKAEIERVDGGSHDLVMEEPERVLAALDRLIKRS
jgi:pimeloyl-ACP methyl ester carboxylesterase